MSIVETQEVRVVRNKSSPETSFKHSTFHFETITSRINAMGKMMRVEIRRGSELVKQISGLLCDIVANHQTTIYHMIDCNTGGRIEIKIGSGEKDTLVHWHNLFEGDRAFQFLPLNGRQHLTFDRRYIRTISKVSSDRCNELITAHIMKRMERKK